VGGGDAIFTDREREDIQRALAMAERDADVRYSVYVGPLGEDSRSAALSQHARLPHPPSSVLVAADPLARRVEIVTGSSSRRWLDDRACALAVLAMTTSFGAGDLAGGLVNGLRSLGEHSRHPRVLHLDEP
jgi:hypothetical protein